MCVRVCPGVAPMCVRGVYRLEQIEKQLGGASVPPYVSSTSVDVSYLRLTDGLGTYHEHGIVRVAADE